MNQALSLWKGVIDVPVQTRSSQSILEEVAGQHRMSVSFMLGADRRKPVVLARRDAIYLLRLIPSPARVKRSLPEIGRIMGGRDHTTVQNSLRKHPEYVEGM